MIIDPDFLDHWRTRMLVDELGGDEMAPVYVLRIWSHCQLRKAIRFDLPPAGLKAICRFIGDAIKFETALVAAGFITREGQWIDVPKWAVHNAKLIAAWNNGYRGGRPRKDEEEEPTENPTVTHGEPNRNPRLTHGEPTANPPETQTGVGLSHGEPNQVLANPRETDRRRVDKIREEEVSEGMGGTGGASGGADDPKTTTPRPRQFQISSEAKQQAAHWYQTKVGSAPKQSLAEIEASFQALIDSGHSVESLQNETDRHGRTKSEAFGTYQQRLIIDRERESRGSKKTKSSFREKLHQAARANQ